MSRSRGMSVVRTLFSSFRSMSRLAVCFGGPHRDLSSCPENRRQALASCRSSPVLSSKTLFRRGRAEFSSCLTLSLFDLVLGRGIHRAHCDNKCVPKTYKFLGQAYPTTATIPRIRPPASIYVSLSPHWESAPPNHRSTALWASQTAMSCPHSNHPNRSPYTDSF